MDLVQHQQLEAVQSTISTVQHGTAVAVSYQAATLSVANVPEGC